MSKIVKSSNPTPPPLKAKFINGAKQAGRIAYGMVTQVPIYNEDHPSQSDKNWVKLGYKGHKGFRNLIPAVFGGIVGGPAGAVIIGLGGALGLEGYEALINPAHRRYVRTALKNLNPLNLGENLKKLQKK